MGEPCSRTRTRVHQTEDVLLENQQQVSLCTLHCCWGHLLRILGGASTGTSPRPLSKVRTSFVTVVGTGGQQGLGLKRDMSGEPSMQKRRPSFSIDEEDNPMATLERKTSIATEKEARKNSSAIEETIPENALQESDTKLSSGSDQRKDHIKPTAKVEEKKPTSGTNGHANGTSKPAAKPVEKSKPVEKKQMSRPPPISTAKSAAAPKLSPKKTKEPVPRTPTTPGMSRSKELPTKTPDKKSEKKVEKKSSRASLAPSHTSKPASKPPTAAAQGAAAKTRIPASPPQPGFHKPRPKSPTRPVKLPASLTAHTASSGSKTATGAVPPPRQPLSRASGNVQSTNSLQAHHTSTRSPSRASTTTTKSTLTRKPSTLKSGSSRPSLGPPPGALKKQPSRQSLPSSAPADDSFLARMMRPTTSSTGAAPSSST